MVIAAITSCTNTSNPSVMIGAGLLAKKAVEKGLTVPAWVKTSLAPGSLVVTEYLTRSGLLPYLEKLKFNVVGYGCTTCIGNSGPLPQEVSSVVTEKDLVVASVLSGNRNFEGRINSEVRANYLMSPPLVVAYALAGRMDIDLYRQPMGFAKGKPVYLKDIWPTEKEVDEVLQKFVTGDLFRGAYTDVFKGDERWRGLNVPQGETFAWDADSTYVQNPPYFENMPKSPAPVGDISGARVLCYLGNSVTTDHISPAGSIKHNSPAGKYLIEHGVKPADFNSYGSRRGNHEVMMRGTFANVRIRNKAHARTRRRPTPAISAQWRGDVHLRGLGEISRRRYSADDIGRQRVRLRLIARLGRQGTATAGRARCSGGELPSAYPSARTWWAWESSRCSSSTTKAPRPAASPAKRYTTLWDSLTCWNTSHRVRL